MTAFWKGLWRLADPKISLAPAVISCRILLRNAEVTSRVVPAQAMILLSFVLYSLGSGIGLLLS